MKILIADSLSKDCIPIIEGAGIQAVYKADITPEDLLKEIGDYEGVLVRSKAQITAKVIEAGKKLKVIGRAGVGVDNVDVEAATKKKIIVMNVPAGNVISAAEHTVALILCTARYIPQAYVSVKGGAWDRKSFVGVELKGRTLGIVGMGKIGVEVATRMKAFGMKVLGFDPIVSKADVEKTGAEYVGLDDLLRNSDFITVHVPKTPQTANMISDAAIAKCKQGVRFINVARGEIMDEAALIRGLNSGKIAAVGVDVYPKEPPENWDLIKHPKVMCTPHLGASTIDAQEKVAGEVAKQAVIYLKEGKIINAVNPPGKK